jgi:hypothetical protein
MWDDEISYPIKMGRLCRLFFSKYKEHGRLICLTHIIDTKPIYYVTVPSFPSTFLLDFWQLIIGFDLSLLRPYYRTCGPKGQSHLVLISLYHDGGATCSMTIWPVEQFHGASLCLFLCLASLQLQGKTVIKSSLFWRHSTYTCCEWSKALFKYTKG